MSSLQDGPTIATDQKIIFLADAHLPRTTEAVDEFLAYVEKRLDGAVGLYLLGDIFTYLIGLPKFRTSGHAEERLFDGLTRISERGLQVGYVGGNRDYFLDALAKTHKAIVFTEGFLEVRPFGIGLHLVHGDTLNAADRQYLTWRAFSRSRAVRAAISMLPSMVAAGIAARLERNFRSTNQAYRIAFPEEACRSYGSEAARRGVKLVLLGHFHDPRSVPCGGATVHVLPDWLSRREHSALFSDGTFVLRVP